VAGALINWRYGLDRDWRRGFGLNCLLRRLNHLRRGRNSRLPGLVHGPESQDFHQANNRHTTRYTKGFGTRLALRDNRHDVAGRQTDGLGVLTISRIAIVRSGVEIEATKVLAHA